MKSNLEPQLLPSEIEQNLSVQFPLTNIRGIYGRDNEILKLNSCFEEVAAGGRKLIFFNGSAGIGKTYLVSCFKKQLLSKGFIFQFAAGKQDQNHAESPYEALGNAFKSLIDQLFQKSENERNFIIGQLEDNKDIDLSLLTELTPELVKLVNVYIKPLKTDLYDIHFRFFNTCFAFLKIFTNKNRPLILFLDDLQWVEESSIDLLSKLLCETSLSPFLFIGNFRNNIDLKIHPLGRLFNRLEESLVPKDIIELKTFPEATITIMMQDIFSESPAAIREFVSYVKTISEGNPLFIKQYLEYLYEKEYFEFEDGWKFKQLSYIKDTLIMYEISIDYKINQIPQLEFDILKTAAYLGSNFGIEMLAAIENYDRNVCIRACNKACDLNLINLKEGKYYFVHDSVQDSFFKSTTQEEEKIINLKIGRALLKLKKEGREIDFFGILKHLNQAISIITDLPFRLELAQLNYKSAIKAKQANAFQNALSYLKNAIFLTSAEKRWNRYYYFTLGVYNEICALEYLLHPQKTAEKTYRLIIQNARTALDQFEAHRIRMEHYAVESEPEKALEIGSQILNEIGYRLPRKLIKPLIIREFLEGLVLLKRNDLKEKASTSVKNKDDKLYLYIQVISICIEPAFFVDPDLCIYLILKLFNLYLKYGYFPYAPYVIASYGAVFGYFTGKFKWGKEIAATGLYIADLKQDTKMKARVQMIYGSGVVHWLDHIKNANPNLQESIEKGYASGDVNSATYSLIVSMFHKFAYGEDLPTLLQLLSERSTVLLHVNQDSALDLYNFIYQYMQNLADSNYSDFSTTQGELSNENDLVNKHHADFNIMAYLTALNIFSAYIFSDYERAIHIGSNSKKYIDSALCMYLSPFYYFFYGLSLAAMYENANQILKQKIRFRLRRILKKFKSWKNNAPQNFEHQYNLLAAERYRILGNSEKCLDNYFKAIQSAKTHGFKNNIAIAYEIAARFYVSINDVKSAEHYLKLSIRDYKNWGINSKADALNKQYQHFWSVE